MTGERAQTEEELRAHLEALDDRDLGSVEIWEKLIAARSDARPEGVEAGD